MTINIKHLYVVIMFLAPISFTMAAAENSESDSQGKTDQAMPACELQEYKAKEEILIGSPKIKISDNRSIKIKGTDYAKEFSADDMYKIDDNGTQYYFRFTEKSTTDNSIYLNNVAWQENKHPITSGRHNIYRVDTAQVKTGKTLTMLGDSITWWSYGRYFRCMLSQSVKGVTFTGPHTDTFGFGHAGEGGNTTDEMLSRLDKIEPSDYYFVLAGTNDWKRKGSEKTFDNIKKIAYTLSSKGGKVIISTLLPRLDNHDDENRKVNSDLLKWGGTGCNCTVFDLDSQFRKLNNKEQYFWDEGLHPNMLGYEKITNIVSKYLNAELNQVN